MAIEKWKKDTVKQAINAYAYWLLECNHGYHNICPMYASFFANADRQSKSSVPVGVKDLPRDVEQIMRVIECAKNDKKLHNVHDAIVYYTSNSAGRDNLACDKGTTKSALKLSARLGLEYICLNFMF